MDGALKVYQKVVQQVWEGLSKTEQENMEMAATTWNLKRGLPDNVKAK